MKRTLVHLAVLVVCGRLRAMPQPVVLFGRVDHTEDWRFAYAA